MCSQPISAPSYSRGNVRVAGRVRLVRGFTLIELMVGMLIGLLATLAVTRVLVIAEEQKRSTTSGSDAQVNGALAIATLKRSLLPAGYGFSQTPGVIGCALSANFKGKPVSEFPKVLAPVVITDGTNLAPDTIRVFSSGKTSYAVPLRMTGLHNPADATSSQKFPVSAVTGVEIPSPGYSGDLMIAAVDSSQPCEVFKVTDVPAVDVVGRADDADGWNPPNFPSHTYDDGNFLINLGSPVDVTYSIGSQTLVASKLRMGSGGSPVYEGPIQLYPNIVNLQALYGKDTDKDGAIDLWNKETPDSNVKWMEVMAIRVAIVARSVQFEKDEVTSSMPLWDIGKAVPVDMGVSLPAIDRKGKPCGLSTCVSLKVDGGFSTDEWKHYRYKVYETVVPLHNMLWRAK